MTVEGQRYLEECRKVLKEEQMDAVSMGLDFGLPVSDIQKVVKSNQEAPVMKAIIIGLMEGIGEIDFLCEGNYNQFQVREIVEGLKNGLDLEEVKTYAGNELPASRMRTMRIQLELTGTEQEKIKGNLYELDYLQHFREVIEKSIPADNYTLIYEHGELTKPAGQYFDGDTDPQLGKFIRFEAQPNDPEALKSLLRKQQKKRTPHTQRDFQLHIAALHDRQIEIEARRIVENVKGLGEPDSPEKTHCAVELSPYFVPLATDKDMERLLSMLPYKSLSLSTLEGRHGVYALIDKSERKKEMKQSLPSVRAQLQTEKSPKVPKKTAKSKHHELEV